MSKSRRGVTMNTYLKMTERELRNLKVNNQKKLLAALRLDKRLQHSLADKALGSLTDLEMHSRKLFRVMEGKSLVDWSKFGIRPDSDTPENSWVYRERKLDNRSDMSAYSASWVIPGTRSQYYWVFLSPNQAFMSDKGQVVDGMMRYGSSYDQRRYAGIVSLNKMDNAHVLTLQKEGRQFHRFRTNSARALSTFRTLNETVTPKNDWVFPDYSYVWTKAKPNLGALRDMRGHPLSYTEKYAKKAEAARAQGSSIKDRYITPSGLTRVDLWKSSTIKVERPVYEVSTHVLATPAVVSNDWSEILGYYPVYGLHFKVVDIETETFRLGDIWSRTGEEFPHNRFSTVGKRDRAAYQMVGLSGLTLDGDRGHEPQQSEIDRRNQDHKTRLLSFKPETVYDDGFRAVCELKDTAETMVGLHRCLELLAALPRILRKLPTPKGAQASLVEVGAVYLLWKFGIQPTYDDAGKYTPSFIKMVKEYFCPSTELEMRPEWPKFLGGSCVCTSRWTSALHVDGDLPSAIPGVSGDKYTAYPAAGALLPTDFSFSGSGMADTYRPAWTSMLQLVIKAMETAGWDYRWCMRQSNTVMENTVFSRLLQPVDISDLEKSTSFTARNHLADTAWELTPWTFLIDWFYDIGSSLKRLDALSYSLPNGHYFDQFWLSSRNEVQTLSALPWGNYEFKTSAKVGDEFDVMIAQEMALWPADLNNLRSHNSSLIADAPYGAVTLADFRRYFDWTVNYGPFDDVWNAPEKYRAYCEPTEFHAGGFYERHTRVGVPANGQSNKSETGRERTLSPLMEPSLALSGVAPHAVRFASNEVSHHTVRQPFSVQTLGTLVPHANVQLKPVQIALGMALAVTCASSLARKLGHHPGDILDVAYGPAGAGARKRNDVVANIIQKFKRKTSWLAENKFLASGKAHRLSRHGLSTDWDDRLSAVADARAWYAEGLTPEELFKW